MLSLGIGFFRICWRLDWALENTSAIIESAKLNPTQLPTSQSIPAQSQLKRRRRKRLYFVFQLCHGLSLGDSSAALEGSDGENLRSVIAHNPETLITERGMDIYTADVDGVEEAAGVEAAPPRTSS